MDKGLILSVSPSYRSWKKEVHGIRFEEYFI